MIPGWISAVPPIYFLVFAVSAEYPLETLRQLHVVFRHGERTPASTYPKDPYIKETFHPYGWGHLTNVGKINPYRQGQWLRKTYGNFIGDRYSGEIVEAHSTQVPRAQMTGMLTLAGLFPPVGDQIWTKNLMWQPIPMEVEPLIRDRLLLTRSCPKFNQLLKQLLDSPEVKSSIEKNQDLYEYLSLHSGMSVKNPYDVEDIYSTLKAEEGLNLDLPEWTKKVYPTRMEKESAKTFTFNTYNDELKRLKGGPLLKKILNDSKAKTEGKNVKKLYVYSGHDATVANVLGALGCWEEQMPAYNAMAIFELHLNESNHLETATPGSNFFVKVKLRNSTVEEPYNLNIPGCPDPCSLSKVFELATPRLPGDLNQDCEAFVGGPEMPDAVQP